MSDAHWTSAARRKKRGPGPASGAPGGVRIPRPACRAVAQPGKSVDTNPIKTELYETRVRAHLLYAWLQAAGDPGLPICQWLWEGAPAGLLKDFSVLDNLFPRVLAEDPDMEPDALETDFDAFTNYSGVEQDQDVADILNDYRKERFLRTFNTLDEVKQFLGTTPVKDAYHR